MLSVNRILIFLLIAIFNSSLYAVDFSRFDIKGIKLGNSIITTTNTLLKKGYTCGELDKYMFYQEDGMTTFGPPKSYELWCKKNKSDTISINFSHKKKVIKIYRSIEYSGIIPEFSKINYKIINKYGKPKHKVKCTSQHGNTQSSDIGWGEIYIKYNKFFKCNELKIADTNTAFTISYITRKDSAGIRFDMFDNERIKQNKKWAKKYRNKYLKNKKQQLDNIDL